MCKVLNSIWHIVKCLVSDSDHDANCISNKLNLSAVLIPRIPPETFYVVKELGWCCISWWSIGKSPYYDKFKIRLEYIYLLCNPFLLWDSFCTTEYRLTTKKISNKKKEKKKEKRRAFTSNSLWCSSGRPSQDLKSVLAKVHPYKSRAWLTPSRAKSPFCYMTQTMEPQIRAHTGSVAEAVDLRSITHTITVSHTNVFSKVLSNSLFSLLNSLGPSLPPYQVVVLRRLPITLAGTLPVNFDS